jgi:phospholipase/lecithinase/hemolysin
LLRTTETANGSGSTLGNYRTQIATAVSTRTGFATLVDGTAIMTTASLVDGVHPTTAGHLLYANYVKSILGIS